MPINAVLRDPLRLPAALAEEIATTFPPAIVDPISPDAQGVIAGEWLVDIPLSEWVEVGPDGPLMLEHWTLRVGHRADGAPVSAYLAPDGLEVVHDGPAAKCSDPIGERVVDRPDDGEHVHHVATEATGVVVDVTRLVAATERELSRRRPGEGAGVSWRILIRDRIRARSEPVPEELQPLLRSVAQEIWGQRGFGWGGWLAQETVWSRVRAHARTTDDGALEAWLTFRGALDERGEPHWIADDVAHYLTVRFARRVSVYVSDSETGLAGRSGVAP